MAENFPSQNLVLSRLSTADQTLLDPHLKRTNLPVRRVLEPRGKLVKLHVFPESGFASIVANGVKPIEVGIIGREGMTGIAVVLGANRSEHETYMQAAGHGLAISTPKLESAIEKSTTLQRALLLAANAFLVQTTRTVLANGRSKLEERLARWLLMAAERLDGEEVPSHTNFWHSCWEYSDQV
jgi:CRP-like cAMP-binding protein